MSTNANTPEADMGAFLEAHKAFHGRDRFTQYEYSAAAVITRHREAATEELRRLLSEVQKNTNLRFHPELTGLNQVVTDALHRD